MCSAASSRAFKFTPDLMPADITGTTIFNLQRNEFSLVQGADLHVVLIADEINRAPAKTQSALLQAMQERRVTIDRDTYTLPPNSRCSRRKTRLNMKGRTRCRKRRKIASCSRSR